MPGNNLSLNQLGANGGLTFNTPLKQQATIAQQPVNFNQPQVQHAPPSTPVKSITTPDGTTTTYHAPTTPLVKNGMIATPTTQTTDAQQQGAISSGWIPQAPQTTPTPTQSQATPSAPQQTSQNVTYPGLIGTLAKTAQTGTENVQNAQNALEKFREEQAKVYSGIESQPIPLQFQQGREQALQRAAATKEAALTQNVQNALTSQGQQLSGLGTAAGLAAPILGQYGQANYGIGGNTSFGVSPSDPFYQTLQSYAKLAANNQLSAIPSSITSNPVLNSQVLQMAKEINPNFNYNTAAGAGSAQQSNAQLSGTATPTAANTVYQGAFNDYQNLQQNVQNVDQFGNLLLSNMQSGGINPTDVKYANKTIAQIRNQLSSQAQGQFDTTFAALKSKISGMLAIGGNETPTELTQDANAILSGSVPLKTLTAVLGRIQQEGNILLNLQSQKVNNAKSLISGAQGAPQSGPIDWSHL